MTAIFTREQKAKAIKRELGYRRKVFPRRVADGKMLQSDAYYEIGIFEAIADDYREAELPLEPRT